MRPENAAMRPKSSTETHSAETAAPATSRAPAAMLRSRRGRRGGTSRSFLAGRVVVESVDANSTCSRVALHRSASPIASGGRFKVSVTLSPRTRAGDQCGGRKVYRQGGEEQGEPGGEERRKAERRRVAVAQFDQARNRD